VTTAEVSAIAAVVVFPLFLAPVLHPPKLPVILRFSRPVMLLKPERIKMPATANSSRPTLQTSHAFVAPVRIPTHVAEINDIAAADAPTVGFSAAPGGSDVAGAQDTTGTVAPPEPPKALVHRDPQPQAPLHVSSGVQEAKLVKKIVPVYPRLALQTRQFGKVRLTTTIGKDGHVKNIQVISGPAFLVPAAIEAVKQWVYQPTLLNGQPVEVIAPVDINFILN
jgi:periplasmic protein TonB